MRCDLATNLTIKLIFTLFRLASFSFFSLNQKINRIALTTLFKSLVFLLGCFFQKKKNQIIKVIILVEKSFN